MIGRAASGDSILACVWSQTVGFACGPARDVAGSCGASLRHVQLAQAVHALNMRVYDTACKIVKLYCKQPGGARTLDMQLRAPATSLGLVVEH